MSALDHPDSVLDDGATANVGHNCVACVTAVLYNETHSNGFATANQVTHRYQTKPSVNLSPERALEIIRDFAALTPSNGKAHPWEESAPLGHYAVFCMGRRHVVYSFKASAREFYIWDPQTEHHFTFGKLQDSGYGPFRSYHFAQR
jgi:hypothetical protein